LDGLSPLLLNAIDKNEILELKISQWINGEIAHEFEFKNAFIEKIETQFSGENSPYEKIQIKIA
jgi:type VI protein secretion system component Hcp